MGHNETMPIVSVDYSKTIIYKIVCNDLPESVYVYIGHTTNFRNRKASHRAQCRTSMNNNIKLYKIIRENGGWDNWNMIEIERFTECKDGNDARKREQYYMNYFKSNLNMNRAFKTEEDHKERKKLVIEPLEHPQKDELIQNALNIRIEKFRKLPHVIQCEKEREEFHKQQEEKIEKRNLLLQLEK